MIRYIIDFNFELSYYLRRERPQTDKDMVIINNSYLIFDSKSYLKSGCQGKSFDTREGRHLVYIAIYLYI